MSCLDCPDYKDFCDGDGQLRQVRKTASGNYVPCRPALPCPDKYPDRYPIQSHIICMQDGEQVRTLAATLHPHVIAGNGICLMPFPVTQSTNEPETQDEEEDMPHAED